MHWDVRKPQNNPKYATMATTGADAASACMAAGGQRGWLLQVCWQAAAGPAGRDVRCEACRSTPLAGRLPAELPVALCFHTSRVPLPPSIPPFRHRRLLVAGLGLPIPGVEEGRPVGERFSHEEHRRAGCGGRQPSRRCTASATCAALHGGCRERQGSTLAGPCTNPNILTHALVAPAGVRVLPI